MTHIHNTIKMELLNKIFIICFFICFIQNSFSQKITGVENIPIYEVCDSTLQNVLDSYIVVAKKCSCCASSWYFQIDLYLKLLIGIPFLCSEPFLDRIRLSFYLLFFVLFFF